MSKESIEFRILMARDPAAHQYKAAGKPAVLHIFICIFLEASWKSKDSGSTCSRLSFS
jgi:hypothetical protein